MAESAVSFLLDQLTVLLLEERKLLGGIGNNAVYIRDELGHMRAFLRAADAKEESDELLKEWVKQVREITYDTEDVLAMYMLRFSYQRRDTSWLNRYIKKMYCSMKNLRSRHRIASEFQIIKLRLENVSKSRERFKDVYNDMNERSSNKTYDTRGDALLLEEAEVVGIEKPKKQLLDWLMQSDDDGLKVISVVGMGGLGKTTLVKKIYDDASVKANFNSHVWITVSENFNLEHLLREMIKDLANEINLPRPQILEAMTGAKMKEYVHEFLKDKTYLIVLDDVWKVGAWESIRRAFPRTSARGRIIITTRLEEVGNVACCEKNDHLYHLNCLAPEKSEELFYRKAFPRNSCPLYLTEISRSILRRCEGLPLAIVVIGGLLATKDNNLEDWKMFERKIGVESQEDSLKGMNKLLSLSYYDLPYYLKACFLYLSIFPEDELLLKWKIIRLWITEGFVVAKEGNTPEEVAESYLNELLNRSLIQVADTYQDGRPRKFRIHDILRNFIISKSKEQNLLTVACGEEMSCPDKIRRMAISTSTKESCNFKYLRSLFWLEYFADSESGMMMFQKVLGGRCRLLKILDIRGAPIESIPTEVFQLYYLTYLGLRRTNIKLIPKSIGNLENLETLDLKKSKVTELPIEILKLHKLRHLLVYTYGDIKTFHSIARTLKAPYSIGCNLTCLQKLCFIDADEAADGIKIVREIGKLTQLPRLGITKLRREDGKDLCSSLGKLTKLRTLLFIFFFAFAIS
ncbi:disease resistance protein RPM1-like [Henckelia pumila]|uniref:disease resistance protein RPM1-like n=1 Tax=Henckelia pumila TaxID=405737 RepID=UPI003C6DD2C8